MKRKYDCCCEPSDSNVVQRLRAKIEELMSRYKPMYRPTQVAVQGLMPKERKKHRKSCPYKRAGLHCPQCDDGCICPEGCTPRDNRHLSKCECSCRPEPPPFMC